MSTLGKLGGAIRRRFAGSEAAPRVRRFRAGVEGLEGRALLSKGLTEFPIPLPRVGNGSIDAMTRGPDGNVWFAYRGDVSVGGFYTSLGEVGKITPAGAVTLFPAPSGPNGLTPGPDGNIWFMSDKGIGKITPAGAVTLFPSPSGVHGLTPGPDGNIWFMSDKAIGKITPAGAVTLFPALVGAAVSNGYVLFSGLTAGPDGNFWFTESSLSAAGTSSDVVGKITPTGQVTTYPIPGGLVLGDPGGIARGRDGQLWFLATNTNTIQNLSVLVSVTTSGRFTSHTFPQKSGGFNSIGGGGIKTGADGNLWVPTNKAILRIDPSGKFTMFPVSLKPNQRLGEIDAGPGRGLSFTVFGLTGAKGWELERIQPTVGQIAANGRVTINALPTRSAPGIGRFTLTPSTLVTGSDGNLWIAVNSDYSAPSGIAIFRLKTREGKRSGH